MKILKTFAAVALVMATTIVGAANAQDQSQQQDPWNGWMMRAWGHGVMGYGGPGSWMMGRGDFNQAMCSVMPNHIEGRLAYIKAELKITEGQEPLWSAYAAAARDNANAMRAHCTIMSRRSGSAASLPDRLEQHEQLMAAQLDAVRAMDKLLKPLYAALSDSQKQTADQLFWGPMGMM
jgi:hypothetical protein